VKPTSDVLKAVAVEWLRYAQQCKLVCVERSPMRDDPCVPDVVGVTKNRKFIEIEIKVTWADFKANREKSSLFRRRFYGVRPWKYYYFVPEAMQERVLAELQEGEGLLTLATKSSAYSGLPEIAVVKAARPDKNSRILMLRDIVRMVAHQSGSLSSALAKIAKMKLEKDVSEAVQIGE